VAASCAGGVVKLRRNRIFCSQSLQPILMGNFKRSMGNWNHIDIELINSKNTSKNRFLWGIFAVLWGIGIVLHRISLICGSKFLSMRDKINSYGEF
jgi:hypothetical protein